MKSTPIPVPGIVLGSYPQRDARQTPPWPTRLFARVARGAVSRRQPQRQFVAAVRAIQQQWAGEAQNEIQARIAQVRARLARDGLAHDAVAQAFAIIAVACRRVLGVELYDTQLIAARLMLEGHLAEMATGEGKTLAAALSAATAALAGIPVHVLTANDYLVERDSALLRPLYEVLSLTTGAVTQPMAGAQRAAAYACNITYCTAKELVFDYLRDGVMAPRRSELEQRAAALSHASRAGGAPPQRMLRGLCMAIVDEADSILIDEARVPLVLSRAAPDGAHVYWQQAWMLSARCELHADFELDAALRKVTLTTAGSERLQVWSAAERCKWLNARHCEDTLLQALSARHLMRLGRDYVVEGERVHIVDETTGRKAAGRAWAQGLHQLVEIKEGCAPSAPLATLAQITYQRFFQRYYHLCGMSGTLMEARRELFGIYGLQVVSVPLRKAHRRVTLPARVFAHSDAQRDAAVRRAQELRAAGRPVLIGSDSVLASEALSRKLTALGLTHAVLNATQDQREAQIIAAAGAPGAITVATNMAGRGTDIVLSEAGRSAGGLHVICCQQNAARRIDRQLLGRCARQGDPGSAEYLIAWDGPLLGASTLAAVLKKFNIIKYLQYSIVSVLWLRRAQRERERRHARERASLLRQDQQRDRWLAFCGPEQ